MTIKISEILADSGIAFGTSGARGLVVDFKDKVCAAFTKAFIFSINSTFEFNSVAIAIDNRPSSYQMAQSCAAALLEMGLKPIYYGVIPTPALAYKAMMDNMPCIMVTGSHIPFDRNGLKFYRPDGEISKSDETKILACDHTFNFEAKLPVLDTNSEAYVAYVNRYLSIFDAPILTGQRIGLYQHSSAGRDLYPELLTSLGADVVCLGRSDVFVPIDTEAVSDADCKLAVGWVAEHQLDVLFSTDGDGDRPLVAGDDGIWLRGDILGLLTSQFLEIDALSVPVSCNTAIELAGFNQVIRTKIGSPYVIDKFDELNNQFKRVAGFEANGGYLLASDLCFNNALLKALPTRDALLPLLAVIGLANQKSIKLKDLVSELPQRFTHSDRIQHFSKDKSQKLLSELKDNPLRFLNQLGLSQLQVKCLDETDGLRLVLSNGDIIHFRPSGNAPELRCYGESSSTEKAKTLVENALIKIINLHS